MPLYQHSCLHQVGDTDFAVLQADVLCFEEKRTQMQNTKASRWRNKRWAVVIRSCGPKKSNEVNKGQATKLTKTGWSKSKKLKTSIQGTCRTQTIWGFFPTNWQLFADKTRIPHDTNSDKPCYKLSEINKTIILDHLGFFSAKQIYSAHFYKLRGSVKKKWSIWTWSTKSMMTDWNRSTQKKAGGKRQRQEVGGQNTTNGNEIQN